VLGKSAFCLVRTREPNLPTDPEANRERFATSRRQPHGNRDGPTSLSVSIGEKAAHHPRVVGVLFRPSVVFAKDGLSRLFFFMLAMPTETLTVPLTVTEPKSVGIAEAVLNQQTGQFPN
jgi:hypothetical protein